LQAQPAPLLQLEPFGMHESPHALLDVQTLQQLPLGSSSIGPHAANIRPKTATINRIMLSSS
jgi:hypothetical protein